jgi:DNA mismatch endonuclease (patch repair protein)
VIDRAEPSRRRPSARVSARFSAQRRTGTRPELLLRQELHRRGRRFRVQVRVEGLPRRRVDIAFTRLRLVVFVDGCFWHGCPDHGVRPRTNSEWWQWKLETIATRDADTDARLGQLGWTVLRIWEHDDPSDAADQVESTLTAIQQRLSSRSLLD